ncbi:MAG: WYL domain-containing protein [Thiohalomonadales bacterium]
MAQAWHTGVPLEIIRFAAANRLCIELEYDNSHRIIEPYSLRKTKDGNILLYAVRHEDGLPRSYRIDRIQGATATKVTFMPRYAIELTVYGPLHAPES